ncbi:MAG: hypothetical protein R3B97_17145 [Dehalococcoidia bacterium]|nr:hypothetical protein [Dehalococcoidia bacterium]MCB9485448.1 hypothetical protein [Thermoflexaceae bacterium]
MRPPTKQSSALTAPAYPADLAQAGLRIFLSWFGPHYARSVTVDSLQSDGDTAVAGLTVGRRWSMQALVANTLGLDATIDWEVARAAIESRLDAECAGTVLWVPRGAWPPSAEPGLSELVLAVEEARTLEDGRREMHRPVTLHLRRVGTTGSVITVLGGLSGHWAQFTNRVPGTFQLNSHELFRLPDAREDREALSERIVLAASQPTIDESQAIPAEDCWTVTHIEDGPSCVVGTPAPDNDEQSSVLRRNLRRLLKTLQAVPPSGEARALIILGAATYAAEEKLSWALRGMDPGLYAGFDLVVVIADGVVKTLLLPGRGALPWDAPLPGQH